MTSVKHEVTKETNETKLHIIIIDLHAYVDAVENAVTVAGKTPQ